MYHLLPVRRLLTLFATLHLGLLLLVVSIFNSNSSLLGFLRYSSGILFALDVVVLIVSVSAWRWFWKRIPQLSNLYFPDLNGIWQGNIKFETNTGELRALEAKVRIKQNLWSIQLDLCSETSKSSTLVAYPGEELGNKVLYYIYQNVPKNPKHNEYKGTSLLSVDITSASSRLNGHYYTVRGTRGRIELKRISPDPNQPYELY